MFCVVTRTGHVPGPRGSRATCSGGSVACPTWSSGVAASSRDGERDRWLGEANTVPKSAVSPEQRAVPAEPFGLSTDAVAAVADRLTQETSATLGMTSAAAVTVWSRPTRRDLRSPLPWRGAIDATFTG